MKFILLSICLALLGTFSSCSSDTPASSDETETTQEVEAPQAPPSPSMDEELSIMLEDVLDKFPAPTNVATALDPNEHFLNEDEQLEVTPASSYNTNAEKAYALGAYLSDVAFMVNYEMDEAVIECMAELRNLTSDMSVSVVFDEKFFNEFNENKENKKGMLDLVDEAYQKADKILRSNEQIDFAVLNMTGAYLESLYLILSTINGETSTSIKDVLNKQGELARPILEALRFYQDNPSHAMLLNQVEPILDVMSTMSEMDQIDEEVIISLKEMLSMFRNTMSAQG